tara:strand:- start:381 stop:959 length:579 start_codon:yes stop_codon:yes gene_type:complete
MPKDDQPEDSGTPEEVQPASEADDTGLVREQLEEALREKEQFRAMAQRAQADLINYRRRAEEERDEVKRAANTELLLKILSIVDDLDRGLGLVPEDAVAPGWLDGLKLVQRNLYQFLDSEGVTKISAEGRPFEPWEHEAVFYEETPEGREGMVVKVIRDGYKLHDRVLRAAQVGVSKASQSEDQSETTQQEG